MENFDVFVIGGGVTGSEIALRLGRRGDMRIGIAERAVLGGECTRHGCLPSKAMVKAAKVAAGARRADRYGIATGSVEIDFGRVMARVRDLIDDAAEGTRPFDDAGVTVFEDEARITGPHELEVADGARVGAERIVLATGSRADAPDIPGLDGAPYWTYKEAIWSPSEVPESLAILGSGQLGIEFAQIYARLGAAVTVIEESERIMPDEDRACSESIRPALESDGIALITSAATARIEQGEAGWRLQIEDAVRADHLLVATGRVPVLDGHDLGSAGVELEGRRPVLSETLRTTGDRIWTAGDATGELFFTHVGTYEAEVVVADICGEPFDRDYRLVPKVTYTGPEVARIGLTEDEAHAQARDTVSATVEVSDVERSRIDGETSGVVKLICDAYTGELLGGHVVAPAAAELIHEIGAAMAGRATLRSIASAVHAHPTYAQAIRDAFGRLESKLKKR